MKKLYRSDDKNIGGVCKGLGDYFNIDDSLIKILFNSDFCVWFNDNAGDPLVYLFRCRENSMVQNFPFINNCIYVIAIFKCYLIELFRFRRPFIRCCARTI